MWVAMMLHLGIPASSILASISLVVVVDVGPDLLLLLLLASFLLQMVHIVHYSVWYYAYERTYVL